MTTYFYGRCSADENFEKGSSIATQIERANAYAVIHNLKIDKETSEKEKNIAEPILDPCLI